MCLHFIVALIALVSPDGATDEPGKKESAPPGPPAVTFDDDESRRVFEEGWKLFLDYRWDEASDRFSAALSGVAKDSRSTIQDCIDACKGGPKLADVSKDMGTGKWRAAHKQLGKLDKKYGDGPLAAMIDDLRREIEGRLFHVLADFEEPLDEKKDAQRQALERLGRMLSGRSRNEDPRFVRSGQGSLQWKPKPSQGRGIGSTVLGRRDFDSLVRFDRKLLEEYRYLTLSVLAPEKGVGKIGLVFDDREDEAMRVVTSGDRAKSDFFQLQPRAKWMDLRIDLWSPKIKKMLSAEEIYGIGMRMHPTVEVSVYFDDVRLERP